MIIADPDDRGSSHSEEDENYFISMTDMMVGILFIFIIMLMVFALNFRQQTDETAEIRDDQQTQVNELSQQIDELRRQIRDEIEELSEADRARGELLKEIKDKLIEIDPDMEQIISIDTKTGVLRLGEGAIRFSLNNSDLDAAAAQNVDALAKALLDVLPRYSICRDGNNCLRATGHIVETVFIEGHTDQSGTDDRNWQLSTERAVNTYRRLADLFPDLLQLKNTDGQQILSVSAYASTRGVPGHEKDSDTAIHRRIDLRFVMESDPREGLTGVLDLLDRMKGLLNEMKNRVADRW